MEQILAVLHNEALHDTLRISAGDQLLVFLAEKRSLWPLLRREHVTASLLAGVAKAFAADLSHAGAAQATLRVPGGAGLAVDGRARAGRRGVAPAAAAHVCGERAGTLLVPLPRRRHLLPPAHAADAAQEGALDAEPLGGAYGRGDGQDAAAQAERYLHQTAERLLSDVQSSKTHAAFIEKLLQHIVSLLHFDGFMPIFCDKASFYGVLERILATAPLSANDDRVFVVVVESVVSLLKSRHFVRNELAPRCCRSRAWAWVQSATSSSRRARRARRR